MDPEVLIIGGGVIGLCIARELHKQGIEKITVLEKGSCGKEASWAAGGMLGPQAEANEGGIFFDLCSASRDLYPQFAAELLDETGIDIELERSGTLYLAFNDSDANELSERFQWQRDRGLEVERLSAEDARRIEPFISPDVREALYFPNDWQVENRKLLTALRNYAEMNGIELCESNHVEALTVESGRVCGVETGRDVFRAEKTILATGAWTSLIKLGDLDIPLNVEPVRGQIVTFQTAKRLFQRVIYSGRGYLVPRADGRILAGSTSEHVGFDKNITEDAAGKLREMASELAPSTAGLAITDHWSGLRPVSSDGLPVIGQFSGIKDLTLATAHYRNGILLAPITAKVICENVISGGSSKFLAAFGPDRFRFQTAGIRS